MSMVTQCGMCKKYLFREGNCEKYKDDKIPEQYFFDKEKCEDYVELRDDKEYDDVPIINSSGK